MLVRLMLPCSKPVSSMLLRVMHRDGGEKERRADLADKLSELSGRSGEGSREGVGAELRAGALAPAASLVLARSSGRARPQWLRRPARLQRSSRRLLE
jgi:hypothetical protein